jgi:hypothetical protein
MLFTKSLEKRRNGTSGTATEEAGKAVAERKCGDGYVAGPRSEKRV